MEQARHQPPGFQVPSRTALRGWLSAEGLGRGRELTVTFVVDAEGILRLADRHSEHVACAAGGPVRAAGEMTFAMTEERASVAQVSNQSTGFCPEPSSWLEVQAALDALGVEHSGRFSEAFDFRKCPSCNQINLIKDDNYECDACEAELPRRWNFGG